MKPRPLYTLVVAALTLGALCCGSTDDGTAGTGSDANATRTRGGDASSTRGGTGDFAEQTSSSRGGSSGLRQQSVPSATSSTRGGTGDFAEQTSSSRDGSSRPSRGSGITHSVTLVRQDSMGGAASFGGSLGSGVNSPCGSNAMLCKVGTASLCIDVTSDSRNCGQCEHSCAPEASCEKGACRPKSCNPTFALGDAPMSQLAETQDSGVFFVVGDFNGDGKLDIAAASAAGDTVSVALGEGNGTFVSRTSYATGDSPTSVAVGDLNGDGWLDLATANSGANTVTVLLGIGNGKLGHRADYPTGAAPVSVTTGDVSDDGIVDLVTANEKDSSVSVLLGIGEGTFSAPMDYPVGSFPKAVVIGDLNGDQWLDLAVADSPKTVSVLLGAGNGSFLAPASTVSTNLHHANALSLGDLDGDGDVDIAVADRSEVDFPGRATVLLGNGDGTFPYVVELSTGRTRTITTGDLNGDGRLDLICAGDKEIRVALAGASGTLAEEVRHAASTLSYGVALGDFDGDDIPDVLTVDQGYSTILFGKGDGTFRTLPSYPTGKTSYAIAVGDMNGDGRQDLVTANQAPGTVSILLGGGDGTFAPHIEYSTASHPVGLEVLDLNRDGALDLVTATEDDGIATTLLNSGGGTFSIGVDYGTGTELAYRTGHRLLAVGDLDGNGTVGIAWGTDANTVEVLLQQDDATFASAVGYPEKSPNTPVLCDLSGDGLLDLVTSNNDESSVHVRLGLGQGSFGPRKDYPTGRPPNQLRAGDLDGDGKLDLVSVSEIFGPEVYTVVTVLLGDGGGGLATPIDYTIGVASGDELELGDLDGDGILDAVVTLKSSIAVLLGAGDGTFGCMLRYLFTPGDLALGDLNADHRLDLVSVRGGSSVDLMFNSPL